MINVRRTGSGWVAVCDECGWSSQHDGPVDQRRARLAAESHRDSGKHTSMPVVNVITEA